MRVARVVREARLAADLSQAELARRAHTSQSAVARYERGVSTPSVATLERLLRACGRPLRLTASLSRAPRRRPTVRGRAAQLVQDRLEDIAEAIRRIRAIDVSVADATARDAILYNLVIIGDAAKHLDAPTTLRAPGTPWRRLAGLRDLLTHEYFRIEMDVIRKIVDRDLGPLERAVVTLRRSSPE